MRYAVVYQSKSGNTGMLAQAIYEALDGTDKVLLDIDEDTTVPEADIYFLGFGIHNQNCGMDVSDYMNKLKGIRYALFITCGFFPTKRYKNSLLQKLNVRMPENSECIDVFLCQGKVEKQRREIMYGKTPHREKELRKIFESGRMHPDANDLSNCRDFARRVVMGE